MITIEEEEFTVIKRSTTEITTIPKYNISLTSEPEQDSSAETCKFSNSQYWKYQESNIDMENSDNLIQHYITAYQTKLNNKGANVVVRVIRRSDLTATGMTDLLRNPGQTGSYWLGTASNVDDYYVSYCYRDGQITNNGFWSTDDYRRTNSFGVRPLVIFNKP